VLAANRNPVADPMPAETTAAGSERGRRSSRPIGLFEEEREQF
jgi:hypothetical protein